MVLSNIIISSFVQIICLQEVQEDHFVEQIYPVLTDMGEEPNINSCLNLWMNEWSIYIVLYCVLLYTQSALQSYRRSLLNHHQCAASTGWCDGSHSTTAPVLSPHTSYRWRGERDRANQVDGDYWETMIDKGQWREFGQDTGVTPLLFTMSVMGFLIEVDRYWILPIPIARLDHTGRYRLINR